MPKTEFTNKGELLLLDTFYLKTMPFVDTFSAIDVDDSVRVLIKATHSGFVNLNDVKYTDKLLKNSCITLVEPFQKKIVLDHSRSQEDAIGIIESAKFVKIKGASEGEPTGYIEIIATIFGWQHMDKIKNKLYFTVSIKAVGTPEQTKVTCNICKKDISSNMFDHEHQNGETYDNVKCFYTIDGKMSYKHVAFVLEPADENTETTVLEDSVKIHTIEGEKMKTKDKTLPDNQEIKDEDKKPEDKTPDEKEKDKKKDEEDNKKIVDKGDEKKGEDVKDDEDGKKKDEDEGNKKDEEKGDSTDNSKAEDSEDELSDFSNATEEDLQEALRMDEILDEITDKLSPEKRKSLPDSVFCGPGRSFPIDDCVRAIAALKLLSKSKFSESTKNKIHDSIVRTAENLKCNIKSIKKDMTKEVENILLREDISKYIKDNYINKKDIDVVIDKSVRAVLLAVEDKTLGGKYQSLKDEYIKLEIKFTDIISHRTDMLSKALKVIKLLSDPNYENIDDVAITTDEIKSFEDTINEISKGYTPKDKGDEEDNKENKKDVENKKEDKEDGENQDGITYIDTNDEKARKEFLSKLF